MWRAWRKAKNGSVGSGWQVTLYRDGRKFRARATRRVRLPTVFCLDENLEKTLEVLVKVRRHVLSNATAEYQRQHEGRTEAKMPRRTMSYVDLSPVKQMGPSAALILAAIYDRAKHLTGAKLHTVDEHKWRPQTRSLLKSLGFHELLEIQKTSLELVKRTDIHIQKFTSGSLAEGEIADQLQSALANLLPQDLSERLLFAEPYGGILEAIENSYRWAYPDDADWDFPPYKRWWLTGAVNLRTNQVTVVVYDQGVSIPVSLPHWQEWGVFERRARRLAARFGLTEPIDHPSNDGLALQLAMKIAKTRTGLPQHGKGLHTMVEVAERARHCRLRIISRNGTYLWETGKPPQSFANRNPLHGTLIEWLLDL